MTEFMLESVSILIRNCVNCIAATDVPLLLLLNHLLHVSDVITNGLSNVDLSTFSLCCLNGGRVAPQWEVLTLWGILFEGEPD